jgi:uncharacterized protein YxjI
MAAPVDPNQHDRFILRQRIQPFINQYEFSLPADDGAAQPVCFVEQDPLMMFKEEIRFFTDDSKQDELICVQARQAFDPSAQYDVTDPTGRTIGTFEKKFGSSLLRSTYELRDPIGNPIALAHETSLIVALFRRLVGFLPYVDDYADWLPIPYHFKFVRNSTVLGTHRRKWWTFRDIYTIDMSGDLERTLDRRLVLAVAVAMDALQAR